jgi:type IV pilus assembly protein PilM
MGTTRTKRPLLGCELTATSVLAARANDTRDALSSVAAHTLTTALSPSITGVNVQDAAALRSALEDAFGALERGGHDVAVVLPDSAARVMLLDFDTLPERPQEATPLIRFRLKKLLPFDADHAAISYQVQRSATAAQVIAAVTQASVLEEYETVFRNAGFHPGIVLPSVLAALGTVDGSVPTLVVKADSGTTAIAIVDKGELRLVRTIESTTPAAAAPERLAEDIYPSLVFFQDTYNAQVRRALLGGTAATEPLRAALEQQTGLKVEDLLDSSRMHASTSAAPRSAFAGIAGALLGD